VGLTAPDSTYHRTKLADWMELTCISAPDGRIGFSMLTSLSQDEENEQAEDIAEEDATHEQHILDVQGELSSRSRSLGANYPFQIDDQGRYMTLKPAFSDVGAIYLFCLYVSHATDRTIIPRSLAPRVTNKVRDLFQACATLAAAGYVLGPAVSFGWPRPDRSEFLKKLKQVYKSFGDGIPVTRPRPAASMNIKDNGIDIIAWRIQRDGLPGTHYLLGQVASGENWFGKPVAPDAAHFHDYWFKVRPSSQVQYAMFIPFCLEAEASDSSASYEEVLRDHMQSLGSRFGVVFYRHRIAEFAAAGMRLHAEGLSEIERVEDVLVVRRWVESYSTRLRVA